MKNINKVIFLVESHFNKRDYDRFGIETLINDGFEVEVWDFAPFLANKTYQMVAPPDPIKWDGHRIFKKEEVAISAIFGLSRHYAIICFLSYNFRSLAVYRAVSKTKLLYCAQAFALPVCTSSPKQRLIKKIMSFTLKKLWMRIFLMVPPKLFGVRPADLNMICAEKSLPAGIPVDEKGKLLWVHSFDYDLFLKVESNAFAVKKDTGVFLDQYLPFHSDSVHSGVKTLFNPQEYYAALCRFFDHLKDNFGVKLIIAAHPRSHYEDMPDLFGGREVIRGKTVELVSTAGFVIAHNSIAINFAVLFKKPLLFLTSDKIIESYNKDLIEEPPISWLASFFKKEAYNIDHPVRVDFDKELVIDEAAYRNYKNYYIKKDGSEELPYWQIFANYIKKEYA